MLILRLGWSSPVTVTWDKVPGWLSKRCSSYGLAGPALSPEPKCLSAWMVSLSVAHLMAWQVQPFRLSPETKCLDGLSKWCSSYGLAGPALSPETKCLSAWMVSPLTKLMRSGITFMVPPCLSMLCWINAEMSWTRGDIGPFNTEFLIRPRNVFSFYK